MASAMEKKKVSEALEELGEKDARDQARSAKRMSKSVRRTQMVERYEKRTEVDDVVCTAEERR